MGLSMRYYDIAGMGGKGWGAAASCGNVRYYVLPSELAIDGTIDRSIVRSTARGRFNRHQWMLGTLLPVHRDGFSTFS